VLEAAVTAVQRVRRIEALVERVRQAALAVDLLEGVDRRGGVERALAHHVAARARRLDAQPGVAKLDDRDGAPDDATVTHQLDVEPPLLLIRSLFRHVVLLSSVLGR